jgi:hypothetical protein
MDKKVALLALFETVHREFMAAEREVLAAMLVVRANTGREAARLAEEATAWETAQVEEVAAVEVAARE